MASEEQLDDAEDASFNSFNNDGSFLERFRRMQEQKNLEEKAAQTTKPPVGFKKLPATSTSFMPATMTSKRVTKGGAVVMKLSGVKKKSESAVKLKKPAAVLGGDSSSEDEGGEARKKEFKEPIFSTPVAPPTATPTMSALGLSVSPSSMTSSAVDVSRGVSRVAGASFSIVEKDPTSSPSEGTQPVAGKKRKRASRWSDAPPSTEVTLSTSKVAKQSADDLAIAEAMASFDALPAQSQEKCHMTEKQLQQIREQIEMNKMVTEIQKAMKEAEQRKSKLDYDSDEDTEGGTWEHKARTKEMAKTRERAMELTEMNKGKHHISDFLPPEELAKFIERVNAIKEGRDPDFSDYKEHKITEENVGFKLLQKAGWTEGVGLGAKEDGITAPINKGKRSFDQSGVGAEAPAEIKKDDDEFDLYRKRMMLAYRFRPNPLNNPRRPYY